MKRFGVGAALAMVIGASLSLAAMSGAYAISSVTCKKVSGTVSTSFTISSCLPVKTGYTTAGATVASLASGSGTLTWKPIGKTTKISTTFKSPGHGLCGTGSEYDIAGKVVTGGTGSYAKVGDVVSAKICNSTAGAITLAPGTTMKL